MFLFFLPGILTYYHLLIVPANDQYEFGEKLDTTLASELMFDVNVVSKGTLDYKLYKPNSFRSEKDTSTPLPGGKYKEKYSVEGDYTMILVNQGDEPVMVSVGSYIDIDQKDEDLSLLSSIVNKSKMNLDNLVNANLKLKELKEFSLRNARKDRRWMLLLCIMPVAYVLVGFVSLRIQKSFFAPRNRK